MPSSTGQIKVCINKTPEKIPENLRTKQRHAINYLTNK